MCPQTDRTRPLTTEVQIEFETNNNQLITAAGPSSTTPTHLIRRGRKVVNKLHRIFVVLVLPVIDVRETDYYD